VRGKKPGASVFAGVAREMVTYVEQWGKVRVLIYLRQEGGEKEGGRRFATSSRGREVKNAGLSPGFGRYRGITEGKQEKEKGESSFQQLQREEKGKSVHCRKTGIRPWGTMFIPPDEGRKGGKKKERGGGFT